MIPRTTLVCAVVALCGCRVFEEGLLDSGALPRDTGVDAPVDAGHEPMDAGGDAGPGCPLTRPPPRPAASDGPSVDEILFALRDIRLDQGEDWENIGFDVDGLCSYPPDPVVECVPPASSSVPEIDGAGGIDNAFGHQVMPLILTTMPDLADQLATYQQEGAGNLIVIVRGWNGGDDDPTVDAVLTQGLFAAPALADGGRPELEIPDAGFSDDDGGVPLPLPVWDGRDWFWVRAETFLGGNPDRPLIRDDNAYIAGRTLVMRLPDRVPFYFAAPTATRGAVIKLTDGVLTVHISGDAQSVDTATLSGRWPSVDILGDIETAAVCIGTEHYRILTRLLDLAADVRATPGTGGPGAVCDAVSVGMTFTGLRGNLGGLSDRFALPTPCADAGAPDAG